MGIDANTHRCRVGLFVCRAGVLKLAFHLNFSILVKVIGAVGFIRILLLIAGIEQNPGPTDLFIYRYQYLLIEVGTKVLRQVFDNKVGNDINNFLNTNPQHDKQLKFMVNKGIIKDYQKKVLPPIDKTPNSTNFDITLLSCLLRNICGLRNQRDPVWETPVPPGDLTLEADITRLRDCRNNLFHTDTVFIDETELNIRWTELREVLTRLNTVAGITDLASLFSHAQDMAIDERLKKEFDDLVKSWSEMDKLVDHGIGEVMTKVTDIEQGTKQIQHKLSVFEDNQTRTLSEVKSKTEQIQDKLTGFEDNQTRTLSEVKSKTEQIQDKLTGFEDNQTRTLSEVKSKTEQIQDKLTGIEDNQTRTRSEVKSKTEQIQDKLTGIEDNQARTLSEVKSKTEQIQDKLTGIEDNQTRTRSEVKSKTEQIHDKLTGIEDNQTRALGEVQSHIDKVRENQTRIEKTLTTEIREIKMQNVQQHVDKLSDIQKKLMNYYKHHFKTLPVLPVLENKDAALELLYESPTMHSIDEGKKDAKEIECFGKIFYKEDKAYNEIYITGDAGVGKTSFCRHLCFLWCNVKCGQNIDKEYEYLSKFDCVFYINLRDTEHYNVVDMIKDFYFEHYDPRIIINILSKSKCLIVLDGLDEWNPKKDGKKTHKLPKREHYENCVYLTTSRPHRIEYVRLSSKDVDHQIEISGIHGESLGRYIEKILNYMNKLRSAERKPSDFISDIVKCGLSDEICIPIIASQLVVLWYEKKLDGMTRTLIYANILEMLFQRAEQREVEFPPSTTSTLQLPDSLSGLIYLNENVSLLYNVCHLSFCSMFKQNENATKLVFSRQQLQSKPYCFTSEEIDFLCKIGLMSTNEVFECISVENLKISFIHKSYLDFFAALFISSFDSSNLFRDVTKTWKCLNDFVQYKNFFLLLAGFSLNSIKTLFENIYLALSQDLTSCRKNALFHCNINTLYSNSYSDQLKSLQNIVVNCFQEVSRSNDKTVELRMEDFLFDKYSQNIDILKRLLLLNTTNVKSLHCDKSEYFDEFDQIKNLQCINIVKVSSVDFVKFTQCMLQNKSTLHTVCIEDDIFNKPLIPELPVRSLHHLTSLSLSWVKIQHNSLLDLVKFLSDNVLIENIKLSVVSCVNHQDDDSDCTLTLNLPQHTKLTSLCLELVNILCNNVNNSSLQSVTLCTFSERIVRLCYSDLFKCLNYSQLEHLDINGSYGYMLDNKTLKTLASTVKSLPCLKSLRLVDMELPDDVLLQLHPQVTQVKIELYSVTMSRQWFHCFVESCVNNSEINVELFCCKITSVDGETHSVLSKEESMKYMSEHLESISTINITFKDDGYRLHFETRSCQ